MWVSPFDVSDEEEEQFFFLLLCFPFPEKIVMDVARGNFGERTRRGSKGNSQNFFLQMKPMDRAKEKKTSLISKETHSLS